MPVHPLAYGSSLGPAGFLYGPHQGADLGIGQVDISLKYDGYIQRQKRQVEQFKKMENKKIPEDMDYDAVNSLRIEAVQKLKEYRPVSIGQASRISGVSPADVSVLMIYLETKKQA